MWPAAFKRFDFYGDLVRSSHPVVKLSALAHHSVFRARLYHKSWIVKPVASLMEAEKELLCQNFFRLIIPHQPDTRLCLGGTPSAPNYYILSEEVPRFEPLPYRKSTSPVYGDYSGLGQALVVALLLEDKDVKNGNIGVDAYHRVVKIDGDCSFSGLMPGEPGALYRLTASVIEALPDLVYREFWAYNWLDYIGENRYYGSSDIVHPDVSTDLCFRLEVNQAILKMVLLPNAFLQTFVDAYVVGGTRQKAFLDFLIARRDELLRAALQSESFCHYVRSPEATNETIAFLQVACEFTTHRDLLLSSGEDKDSFLSQVETRWSALLDSVSTTETEFPSNREALFSPEWVRRVEQHCRELLAMVSVTDEDTTDFSHLTALMTVFQEPLSRPIRLLQIKSRIENGVVMLLQKECQQRFAVLQSVAVSGDDLLHREMADIKDTLFKTIHHPTQLMALRQQLVVMKDTMLTEEWRLTQQQRKASLILACQSLLRELQMASDPTDRILCAVVDEYTRRVDEACSIKTLQNSENDLQTIRQQVLSPEIQKIMTSIDALRARGGPWVALAETLQSDFYKTPLKHRSSFLYHACEAQLNALKKHQSSQDTLLRNYLIEMNNKLSSSGIVNSEPVVASSVPSDDIQEPNHDLESSSSGLIEPQGFVEKMGGNIVPHSQSSLCEMWADLSLVLLSVTSTEVAALKEKIQQWNGDAMSSCSPWVSKMKHQRAQALESALFSIPLAERAHVMSGPENKVQTVLATHYPWFGAPKVYRNPAGQIDEAQAPRYFVTLRHTFFAPPAPSAVAVREASVVPIIH